VACLDEVGEDRFDAAGLHGLVIERDDVPGVVVSPDVRTFSLARSFVDYKISAIDATWSGLCFARRRAERALRA
jgi:hypothetical protein